MVRRTPLCSPCHKRRCAGAPCCGDCYPRSPARPSGCGSPGTSKRRALATGGPYTGTGPVSYRDNGDGTRNPYELNVAWYSALTREDAGALELQVARFIASRAIALMIAGVPGIYLPSVFGSTNDVDAVRAGEEARAINRDTIDVPDLLRLLRTHGTSVSKVAHRFGRLIRVRMETRAFHPHVAQRILVGNEAVFAVLRTARAGELRVLACHVSAQPQHVSYPLTELGAPAGSWLDLLSTRTFEGSGDVLSLRLRPYDVLWLRAA